MDTILLVPTFPEMIDSNTRTLAGIARKAVKEKVHFLTRVFSSAHPASLEFSERFCYELKIPAKITNSGQLSVPQNSTSEYFTPKRLRNIDFFLEQQGKDILSAILVVDPLLAEVYPDHYWRNVLHQKGGVCPIRSKQAALLKFEREDSGYRASCRIFY